MVIYIIEDDKGIAELINIALKSHSYETYIFDKAEKAIKNLDKIRPNLIILDVMLPGMDGISSVSVIRNKLKYTPIILLTAKDSEVDKIKGLTSGADDYLTKPFSVMELIARVGIHIKKDELLKNIEKYNKESEKLELNRGRIKINIFSREVFVDNQLVEFTYKEYELLRYILENENKAISREEILDKIWGYQYLGETRTVDIHIKSIRKKIGDLGEKIKTIRGVGYKFVDK